jgi:hypothetical protein
VVSFARYRLGHCHKLVELANERPMLRAPGHDRLVEGNSDDPVDAGSDGWGDLLSLDEIIERIEPD